jgi:hypothetical protein
MLEIQHMHELDRVCHFVMGFPTWAKSKLEENWTISLSKAIMKVEGFSNVGRGEKSEFKKENKFLHKKACSKDYPKPKLGNGGSKVIALTTNLAQGECNRLIFLKGKVFKRDVLCLLDTWASRNFITQKNTERMEL